MHVVDRRQISRAAIHVCPPLLHRIGAVGQTGKGIGPQRDGAQLGGRGHSFLQLARFETGILTYLQPIIGTLMCMYVGGRHGGLDRD